MRRIILVVYFLVSSFIVVAQEQEKDTIQKIEEVVITGQYSKQSVKKSVYEVKVISNRDIQQNAANNLADILNQNLNIKILPNSQTGKSEVSLFGLDGQYFKVLLDGIPMVSDEGFGNNIDLTQIKLDDIKQIEVVEGAMGVEYGANAVTGIINLITDKSLQNKTSINVAIQEETVGNEYEWWNKGRHIQSFSINQGLSKHWLVNFNANRNDFRGYLGDRKGKNYLILETPSKRGYEWLPKEQTDVNATINFNKEKYNFFYKFGYLREMMHDYSRIIIPGISPLEYTTDSSLVEKTGNDRNLLTRRYIHNLNSNGVIGKVKFDFAAAFQQQYKDVRNYTYDLFTHQSTYQEYKPYLNRKTLYLKNTYSNFVNIPKTTIQAGYEYNYEKGYTAASSQDYSKADVSLTMNNWDVFISSEYKPTEKLALRAGGRYSFQSFFDDQKVLSLSGSYLLSDKTNLKIVYGGSYRTPNYQELYESFVNESHIILGNPDLKVERGHSIFTHFSTNLFQNQDFKVDLKFSIGNIFLRDKIDQIIKSLNPIEYTYINVDKVHSSVGNNDIKIQYQNFQLNWGTSVVASKKDLSGSNIEAGYLYSFKTNANLGYTLPQKNIFMSLSYKYNGPEDEWMEDVDDGDTNSVYKIRTNGYHWADFSVKKGFFNNRFETTFGVRNLFNVSDLERYGVGQGGQTHSNDSSGIALGYGRSYFMKLAYNFKSKN